MTLSLAIDQIQRPSWWHENDRDQSKTKPITAEIIAKRRQVLTWLRRQKRKLPAKEAQLKFGLTNSQLWHLLTPLVEDGRVIKYKIRHDKCLIEAAKLDDDNENKGNDDGTY